MTSYSSLASCYDLFTEDVNYPLWVDFLLGIFKKHGVSVTSILDLACGTGTLSHMFAKKGFEVIAVDASEDMLAAAARKKSDNMPLFLCQRMEALDLYGTVDVAVSCLDSVNYLAKDEFDKVLQRLHLFLNPEGLFVFDVKTDEAYIKTDGQVFLKEAADAFAVWSADYYVKERVCEMNLDLFIKAGALWDRRTETHFQYAYRAEEIETALKRHGFLLLESHEAPKNKTPGDEPGRVFYVVRREG